MPHRRPILPYVTCGSYGCHDVDSFSACRPDFSAKERRYIRENPAADLSIQALAQRFHQFPTVLKKNIRELTGKPSHQ